MAKYKLSAEELLVIELLFLASPEENCIDMLSKYAQNGIFRIPFKQIIPSLQEKGVILKSYKMPSVFKVSDADSVEFNANFLKDYRKFSGELGVEFFNAYPDNIIINGSIASLKNWSKVFDNESDMYFAYGKAIGWKEEKHKEVLALIEWAKQYNPELLNTNIGNFIKSKLWETVRKAKDQGLCGKFDTIRAI